MITLTGNLKIHQIVHSKENFSPAINVVFFKNPNGDLRRHKWTHITEKLTATKIVGNDAQEREALTVPKLYILKKRLTHVIYVVN